MNEISEMLKACEDLGLSELDVETKTNFKSESITAVRLKFPKKTWMDLRNKESKLLPYCCTYVEYIRIQFIEAFHQKGWLDAESMQTVAINMKSHNHHYDEFHPVSRVEKVYTALEKFLLIDKNLDVDLNDLRSVLMIVKFNKVWKWCASYIDNTIGGQLDTNPTRLAAHNKALYDIIPVVKILAEKIQTAGLPSVEGYALIRKASNKIYELFSGLAIFTAEEEAYDVLKKWIKTNQIKEEDVEIKACKVSWEKGVELLETVENLFKVKKNSVSKKEFTYVWKSINKIRGKIKNDKVENLLLQTLKRLQKINKEE